MSRTEYEDQIIETIQFDRNENGIFEKVITESDIPDLDGVLHYFDEDEDGKLEFVGIDLDRDGADHLRSLASEDSYRMFFFGRLFLLLSTVALIR